MATRTGLNEGTEDVKLDVDLMKRLGRYMGAWTTKPCTIFPASATLLILTPLDLPDVPFQCRKLMLHFAGAVGGEQLEVCLYKGSVVDANGIDFIKSAAAKEIITVVGTTLRTRLIELDRTVILDRREGPWMVAIRIISGQVGLGCGGVGTLGCFVRSGTNASMPPTLSTKAATITAQKLSPAQLPISVLALTLTGERFFAGADNLAGTIQNLLYIGTAPITVTTVQPGFQTIGLADDGVSNAKLRNSVALSVIGRSTNTPGDPADIFASNPDEVLRNDAAGTTLAFGTVATGGIANLAVTTAKLAADAVDNTKLANMAGATVKGRVAGGAADPQDLTAAQLEDILATANGNEQAVSTVTTTVVGPTNTATIFATAAGEAYGLDATVVCRHTGTGVEASYKLHGRARNIGGALTVTSATLSALEDAALAACNVVFAASGTNIVLSCTGLAGITINWKAAVKLTRTT